MTELIQIKVPGKWTLVGEHTVLRGGTAIAFPHPLYQLELSFKPSLEPCSVYPLQSKSTVVEMLKLAEAHCKEKGKPLPQLTGHYEIKSSIPIGAGLGSSAALSVAITLLIARTLALNSKECFEMAQQLEASIHGKSSGMDIAVLLANEPISFTMKDGMKRLGFHKLPFITLHDTGLRTSTRQCILKVEALLQQDPQSFQKTDAEMNEAQQSSLKGLKYFNEGRQTLGLEALAQGIKKAQACYLAWKLLPEYAKELEEKLLRQGALAVKLTGAGGGGFLMALWPSNQSPLSP